MDKTDIIVVYSLLLAFLGCCTLIWVGTEFYTSRRVEVTTPCLKQPLGFSWGDKEGIVPLDKFPISGMHVFRFDYHLRNKDSIDTEVFFRFETKHKSVAILSAAVDCGYPIQHKTHHGRYGITLGRCFPEIVVL